MTQQLHSYIVPQEKLKLKLCVSTQKLIHQCSLALKLETTKMSTNLMDKQIVVYPYYPYNGIWLYNKKKCIILFLSNKKKSNTVGSQKHCAKRNQT